MPDHQSAKGTPRVVPLALDSDPDRLFSEKVARERDFRFDDKTAQVFDDMVERSVPFYTEMQRMTTELAADFAVPGSNLYDFGCATGTTLIALDKTVDPGVRFVGVDNSVDMLGKAHEKLKKANVERACAMVEADLNKPVEVENASVSLLLLTLQFIRPLYRERFVKAIAAGTNERGCLILIEKLTSPDTLFNRLFIDYYYNYKRWNGYSDTEIARKREALENVLIPYREEENRDLLLNAGFKSVEVFFRWYNFCGFIAVK
ncbi:MAG: carboxy-S-adenosyl-L-methionine synthase CmoA [Alphaproteobacteria bacterium]|nr:carboxy-S-adenosyl-L-methionine synthase CmoA [Alphaproteobacteria bacterium]